MEWYLINILNIIYLKIFYTRYLLLLWKNHIWKIIASIFSNFHPPSSKLQKLWNNRKICFTNKQKIIYLLWLLITNFLQRTTKNSPLLLYFHAELRSQNTYKYTCSCKYIYFFPSFSLTLGSTTSGKFLFYNLTSLSFISNLTF